MFFLALFVWIPFFGGSAAALAPLLRFARGGRAFPLQIFVFVFLFFVFWFLLLQFQIFLFSYVCFSERWNFDRSVGFFVFCRKKGTCERAKARTCERREAGK